MNTQEIPMVELSKFIFDLAKRHGVVYVRNDMSELAQVVTRLSDDDVSPDDTEKLVIALRRANIIDGATMVTLLGRYFDETHHIDAGDSRGDVLNPSGGGLGTNLSKEFVSIKASLETINASLETISAKAGESAAEVKGELIRWVVSMGLLQMALIATVLVVLHSP
jgi:hypothetical protein